MPFISDGAGADDRWIQLVAFYVPLLLAFALNAAIYIRVGRTFRRMARSGAVDAAKERVIQLRLRLYLLIFLCVWALPLAHRSLELAGYDPQWLRLGHTVTQCSMGWLNGLVYGCNEATLRPFRDAFGQIGCSLLRGIQLTPVGWRRSRDAALSSSSRVPSSAAQASAAAAAVRAAAMSRAASPRRYWARRSGCASTRATAVVAASGRHTNPCSSTTARWRRSGLSRPRAPHRQTRPAGRYAAEGPIGACAST